MWNLDDSKKTKSKKLGVGELAFMWHEFSPKNEV